MRFSEMRAARREDCVDCRFVFVLLLGFVEVVDVEDVPRPEEGRNCVAA